MHSRPRWVLTHTLSTLDPLITLNPEPYAPLALTPAAVKPTVLTFRGFDTLAFPRGFMGALSDPTLDTSSTPKP